MLVNKVYKFRSKDINILSDMYVNIGREFNINPSDIDKYLWEVGNSYCNNKRCEVCPLSDCCGKR